MIVTADCLAWARSAEANSIDAIVTDPPYGLKFMGKEWDHGIPGVAFWQEFLRVAKPGCHLLAFGGTRTFHRLAVAIEDAGWEIRDTLMWVYGSGFPKSHNVGKAIDKAAGAQREVVSIDASKLRPNKENFAKRTDRQPTSGSVEGWKDNGATVTAPATDAAKQWDGWGTALKPAWEPIILARKPLEGTVAANVQKWGTGALNIDGCRVKAESRPNIKPDRGRIVGNSWQGGLDGSLCGSKAEGTTQQGRWPANLIHDGSEEVLELFPQTGASPKTYTRKADSGNVNSYAAGIGEPNGSVSINFGDSGSAARFFYCAKASRAERNAGCEGRVATDSAALTGRKVGSAGLEGNKDNRGQTGNPYAGQSGAPRQNAHPTVKPLALMRYLCRLVTPPDGLILDPFCGSGSTGCAAAQEGFRFVGIEQNPEYAEIARKRIEHVA